MLLKSLIVRLDNLCESVKSVVKKYSTALRILFIQSPCETIFGIFHFKAKSG